MFFNSRSWTKFMFRPQPQIDILIHTLGPLTNYACSLFSWRSKLILRVGRSCIETLGVAAALPCQCIHCVCVNTFILPCLYENTFILPCQCVNTSSLTKPFSFTPIQTSCSCCWHSWVPRNPVEKGTLVARRLRSAKTKRFLHAALFTLEQKAPKIST